MQPHMSIGGVGLGGDGHNTTCQLLVLDHRRIIVIILRDSMILKCGLLSRPLVRSVKSAILYLNFNEK